MSHRVFLGFVWSLREAHDSLAGPPTFTEEIWRETVHPWGTDNATVCLGFKVEHFGLSSSGKPSLKNYKRSPTVCTPEVPPTDTPETTLTKVSSLFANPKPLNAEP